MSMSCSENHKVEKNKVEMSPFFAEELSKTPKKTMFSQDWATFIEYWSLTFVTVKATRYCSRQC